jgi:hypothetical protein
MQHFVNLGFAKHFLESHNNGGIMGYENKYNEISPIVKKIMSKNPK